MTFFLNNQIDKVTEQIDRLSTSETSGADRNSSQKKASKAQRRRVCIKIFNFAEPGFACLIGFKYCKTL